MTRKEILDSAQQIVHHDRNAQYGEPKDNFRTIAALWNTYLDVACGHVLRPHDIAVLQILQKVARIAVSPHVPDHWVDIAGYAACGGECAERLVPPINKLQPTDPHPFVESHNIDDPYCAFCGLAKLTPVHQ